jgi:hypothetical protein
VRAAVLKAAPLPRGVSPQHIVPARTPIPAALLRESWRVAQCYMLAGASQQCIADCSVGCAWAVALPPAQPQHMQEQTTTCIASAAAAVAPAAVTAQLRVQASPTHLPSSVHLFGLSVSRFSTAATGYQAYKREKQRVQRQTAFTLCRTRSCCLRASLLLCVAQAGTAWPPGRCHADMQVEGSGRSLACLLLVCTNAVGMQSARGHKGLKLIAILMCKHTVCLRRI